MFKKTYANSTLRELPSSRIHTHLTVAEPVEASKTLLVWKGDGEVACNEESIKKGLWGARAGGVTLQSKEMLRLILRCRGPQKRQWGRRWNSSLLGSRNPLCQTVHLIQQCMLLNSMESYLILDSQHRNCSIEYYCDIYHLRTTKFFVANISLPSNDIGRRKPLNFSIETRTNSLKKRHQTVSAFNIC